MSALIKSPKTMEQAVVSTSKNTITFENAVCIFEINIKKNQNKYTKEYGKIPLGEIYKYFHNYGYIGTGVETDYEKTVVIHLPMGSLNKKNDNIRDNIENLLKNKTINIKITTSFNVSNNNSTYNMCNFIATVKIIDMFQQNKNNIANEHSKLFRPRSPSMSPPTLPEISLEDLQTSQSEIDIIYDKAPQKGFSYKDATLSPIITENIITTTTTNIVKPIASPMSPMSPIIIDDNSKINVAKIPTTSTAKPLQNNIKKLWSDDSDDEDEYDRNILNLIKHKTLKTEMIEENNKKNKILLDEIKNIETLLKKEYEILNKIFNKKLDKFNLKKTLFNKHLPEKHRETNKIVNERFNLKSESKINNNNNMLYNSEKIDDDDDDDNSIRNPKNI